MLDLSTEQLAIVKKILAKHLSNYEVWAFGSRVTGKAKKYSGLDLAIISDTPVPILTIALVKEDLSESDLSFKVDIIDWATITDSFRKVIKEKYTVIHHSEIVAI